LSSGDSPSWCVSSGPSAAKSLDEHYGRDHLLTTDLLSSSLIAEHGIRLRLRFTAFVLSYPTRAVRDSCGKICSRCNPDLRGFGRDISVSFGDIECAC
jgi:hypothetical protein